MAGIFLGIVVYFATVILAVVKELPYRHLRQLLPYALVAVFVTLTNKHGLWDAVGFFVLLSACTWVTIWGTKRQWEST